MIVISRKSLIFAVEIKGARGVAQLAARHVRDVEVGSSSLLTPTKKGFTHQCEPFFIPASGYCFSYCPIIPLDDKFLDLRKKLGFQTRRLSFSNKSLILHLPVEPAVFDQVLGISSFHGEKSPNFSFKLLIFRGFTNIID